MKREREGGDLKTYNRKDELYGGQEEGIVKGIGPIVDKKILSPILSKEEVEFDLIYKGIVGHE